MVQKVLVKRQAEALALQPAGGLLLRHIISQMTLYLCWHGICGAVTLNPAEWKNHKHPTLLQDVSMCVCIKHSKVLNFETAYFPLPSFLSSLFFLSQQDILTRSGILANQCFTGDSPVQQQDGILPGSPCVGAKEVGSMVIPHRLQQVS